MKVVKMKCSITGILERVTNKSLGFTIAQIRKHYNYSLEGFIKDFTTAREAIEKNDIETVREFFETYC